MKYLLSILFLLSLSPNLHAEYRPNDEEEQPAPTQQVQPPSQVKRATGGFLHGLGLVLQGAGNGLQNSSQQQLNCTSFRTGAFVHTECK